MSNASSLTSFPSSVSTTKHVWELPVPLFDPNNAVHQTAVKWLFMHDCSSSFGKTNLRRDQSDAHSGMITGATQERPPRSG